jgi:hypothetical protein
MPDELGFGDFDPFEETEGFSAARDLEEVLDFLTQAIENGKLNTVDAIDAILNLMRPGATDSSHDILMNLHACLHALDASHIADNIGVAWLSSFPWGFGLHLGFHKNFTPTANDNQLMTKALFGVLKAGSSPVAMKDGKIMITDKDGIERIVSAFREELDTEPPEPSDDPQAATDWLKRWMG